MSPDAPILLPQELITSKDREDVLRLFAEVLDEAETAGKQADRRSVMLPGPLWLLARQHPPEADLRAYLNGVLPSRWPAWFGRNLEAVRQDPLRTAFQLCVESCTAGAVSSGEHRGQDSCRIMAAVVQTLYCTNSAIISRNRTLARSYPRLAPNAEWTDEGRFVTLRPDERGGCVTSGNWKVWMASHAGPKFADKMENQDAVCAAVCGAGIVFALADGVSTSLGSRFAAAMAVHRFCAELKRLLAEGRADGAMLIEAARRTQNVLDETLERILCDPAGSEMESIRGPSIQPSLASALLRNTQTAEKAFLQPALATTLIGGVVDGSPSGESRCIAISIGDGAVERIGEDGTVSQVIATDPEVMAIEGSLGAGPRAREILERQEVKVLQIALRKHDHLLISSDGLTRGHQGSVYHVTTQLLGDFLPRLRSTSQTAAFELLQDLASSAESKHPDASLFDDNLSVILVEID